MHDCITERRSVSYTMHDCITERRSASYTMHDCITKRRRNQNQYSTELRRGGAPVWSLLVDDYPHANDRCANDDSRLH